MVESSRRIVVVGGSAAGMRAACRAKRLQPQWSVTVVEAGEIFSYGACGLPYVLSGDIDNLEVLRQTLYGRARDAAYFASAKGVEVRAGRRAVAVDVGSRTLDVEGPDGRETLPWDELVLATGARARRLEGQPDHPRVQTFHVWDDVAPLKRGLARGELERVAVIGAGLVGCELAEAFHSLWGAEVTLIERAPHPLPEVVDGEVGAVVAAQLRSAGVDVRCGRSVERIVAGDDGVRVGMGDDEIEVDAVVVAIGVRPAVELAVQAGVALGRTGAIAVDDRLATSVPHVWAAGDCAECRHRVTGEPAYLPLGSLANRQGRVLGSALAGREDRFPPVTGAVAVKVFDYNVAAVGCTAVRLRSMGRAVRSVWIAGEDGAHYWPENKLVLLTLVYDPASREVLGVQGVGEGEVAKRIDVASQIIARGGTLEDLAHIEHAYAPPYAPAIDPLATLAFAAQNQEDGIEAVSPIADLGAAVLLDVRTADERAQRPIVGAESAEIDVEEVRVRMADLPAGDLTVVCAHGTRAAETARWLRQQGRRAAYLGGGSSWRVRTSEQDID